MHQDTFNSTIQTCPSPPRDSNVAKIPLIKEYTFNHISSPPTIFQGTFLNYGILGSLGSSEPSALRPLQSLGSQNLKAAEGLSLNLNPESVSEAYNPKPNPYSLLKNQALMLNTIILDALKAQPVHKPSGSRTT